MQSGVINMKKIPLLVHRNTFFGKETLTPYYLQTSWVQNDLMIPFQWVSFLQGWCLQNTLEVISFSFWCWCGLQASLVLKAWKAATTAHLLWVIFLNQPIWEEWCQFGVCGVNFWRHGGFRQQSHMFVSVCTCNKLKSGISEMHSWQNTVLSRDLWLQPWKYFQDMIEFAVFSEDSKKEKRPCCCLHKKRVCGFTNTLKWFYLSAANNLKDRNFVPWTDTISSVLSDSVCAVWWH